MASENITQLPNKRNARTLARAYMMGELDESEYPDRGGLRKAMLLADSAESDIAAMQALAFIEKLADLSHDVDVARTMQIKLIGIKNDGNDNAVRIESA